MYIVGSAERRAECCRKQETREESDVFVVVVFLVNENDEEEDGELLKKDSSSPGDFSTSSLTENVKRGELGGRGRLRRAKKKRRKSFVFPGKMDQVVPSSLPQRQIDPSWKREKRRNGAREKRAIHSLPSLLLPAGNAASEIVHGRKKEEEQQEKKPIKLSFFLRKAEKERTDERADEQGGTTAKKISPHRPNLLFFSPSFSLFHPIVFVVRWVFLFRRSLGN